MKRNWKKLVLIVAVVLLVAIQLVPVDRSNPPVEADLAAPPPAAEPTVVVRAAAVVRHGANLGVVFRRNRGRQLLLQLSDGLLFRL